MCSLTLHRHIYSLISAVWMIMNKLNISVAFWFKNPWKYVIFEFNVGQYKDPRDKIRVNTRPVYTRPIEIVFDKACDCGPQIVHTIFSPYAAERAKCEVHKPQNTFIEYCRKLVHTWYVAINALCSRVRLYNNCTDITLGMNNIWIFIGYLVLHINWDWSMMYRKICKKEVNINLSFVWGWFELGKGLRFNINRSF